MGKLLSDETFVAAMNKQNAILEVLAANKSAESLKIDATLTISGHAADAKAVGDKLAGKANSSEVTSIRNDLQNEIDRATDAESQIKEDLSDITQIDKSSNVLEISDYTEGRYYSTSSGDYRYNNNFFTVDNYVEVEPSSSYVLSEFVDGRFRKLLSSIIIFYDKNKKYLSGGQYSTFATAENVKYIRLSPDTDALGKQLSLEKRNRT